MDTGKSGFYCRNTPVTTMAPGTRAWLKAGLPPRQQPCCVGNVCVCPSSACTSGGGVQHVGMGVPDARSCRDKSENPRQDPHGSPGHGHSGIPRLPPQGFSEKPQVRAGRDESDHYLIQDYHFTHEISLCIPTSHMALRLVSADLNHKDGLALFIFLVGRYWLK